MLVDIVLNFEQGENNNILCSTRIVTERQNYAMEGGGEDKEEDGNYNSEDEDSMSEDEEILSSEEPTELRSPEAILAIQAYGREYEKKSPQEYWDQCQAFTVMSLQFCVPSSDTNDWDNYVEALQEEGRATTTQQGYSVPGTQKGALIALQIHLEPVLHDNLTEIDFGNFLEANKTVTVSTNMESTWKKNCQAIYDALEEFVCAERNKQLVRLLLPIGSRKRAGRITTKHAGRQLKTESGRLEAELKTTKELYLRGKKSFTINERSTVTNITGAVGAPWNMHNIVFREALVPGISGAYSELFQLMSEGKEYSHAQRGDLKSDLPPEEWLLGFLFSSHFYVSEVIDSDFAIEDFLYARMMEEQKKKVQNRTANPDCRFPQVSRRAVLWTSRRTTRYYSQGRKTQGYHNHGDDIWKCLE